MTHPVVLVAEPLAESALRMLADSFEVRHVDGADRDALLAALPDADAIIIRSETRMDAAALAAGKRLRVVARAGVGLDNVDVAAATPLGVMVVNAPTSNITSAAEHAVALLLAAARRLSAADASLKSGAWQRSAFTGIEVADKTVGVIGLGRVGVLFAQRMAGFGVRLVAYDPYVPAPRAGQLGVQLMSLEELLRVSDFVSIHLPKTAETKGLIGERELALMKPGAILVNAARGGLVDEAAMAVALKSGQLAGAGLDVFDTEPCTDSPVFTAPHAVVTPHLGASTREAQDKAGTAVARSVKLALSGEFVPDAVNVQAGGPVAEELRPALPLVERLGRVVTALSRTAPASVTVEVRGEFAAYDASILQLAVLRGLFAAVVETDVTFVNAPLLAEERGIVTSLVRDPDSPDYHNLISVRTVLASGETISVSGTLSGPRQIQKLTEVNGFDLEVVPSTHMAFLSYDDRPGVVGTVGRLLGAAGVNIAGMQVSRRAAGGEALMVLTVDSGVPSGTLEAINEEVGASAVHAVHLPES